MHIWLVEYTQGNFINAADISWLSLDNGVVRFATHGFLEGSYQVAEGYEDKFLNHVQAINQNHAANIQTSAWRNTATEAKPN